MKNQQQQQTPGAEHGYTEEEERCIIEAAFYLARKQRDYTRSDIKYVLGWSVAQWQTITAVCNAYRLVPDASSPEEKIATEDFVKRTIQTAMRLTWENSAITRMDILHALAWGPTQWIQLNVICDKYQIAPPPAKKVTPKGSQNAEVS